MSLVRREQLDKHVDMRVSVDARQRGMRHAFGELRGFPKA